MDSIAKDDERGELEPPILQGLAQAVPQMDPSPELRARVLNAAAPRSASSPNRFVAWRLATAASLALAAGLAIYTSQLRGRITGLERELIDSRTQSAATRLLVADAQTQPRARSQPSPYCRRPTSPAWISPGNPCRRTRPPGHSGAAREAWCSAPRTCLPFPPGERINYGS